jgi:hypothetical protein
MQHTRERRVILAGILVGKPEEKRPLGRLRHRWENNSKMSCRDMDWFDLAKDEELWRALVNTVTKLP